MTVISPPITDTGQITDINVITQAGSGLLFYLPMVTRTETPKKPIPANAASRVSPNTYLAWVFEDSRFSDVRYTIYLEAGDLTPDTVLATNLTEPHFDPATFDLNTDYYWQVAATSADGRWIAGPVWRFKTDWVDATPDIDAMVSVPGGEFRQGCDASNPAEYTCSYNIYHMDEPVRSVYIDSFEIDKFEVTTREYRACVAAGKCNLPRRLDSATRGSYFYNRAYDYFPVLFVSWWDAGDYCAWEGKRLPTEAEWEKAARGPIDTRVWPWGNETPDCTRLNSHAYRNGNCAPVDEDVTKVGVYPRGASPYGALDMSGNVFEWVSDKYDVRYYEYAPNYNPQGPTISRVEKDKPPQNQFSFPVFSIRGGSWKDNGHYARTAHRHWGHHGDFPNTDEPYFRNDKVGFRCARSLD